MSKVENGNRVSVHYVGTFEDGLEFDSSRSTGVPLDFEVGSGRLLEGFETSVVGMAVGDTKTITLAPTEAYGEVDPSRTKAVPRDRFAPGMELEEGVTIQGQTDVGVPFVATIQAVNEEDVILDLNHPMAGKTINFEIEVVSIDK